MSYMPHGNYPKDQGSFNLIKIMPNLFKGIDFGNFIDTIGGDRFTDCTNGIIFLHSSQYQENDGAKLVMMLSAIERANGKWEPLETTLLRGDFKKEMTSCATGTEAFNLLYHKIDDYLDNFGSTRSVVSFFQKNLTLRQKQIFTRGVHLVFKYKKKPVKDGLLLIPNYNIERGDVDKELGRLLRNTIYAIRNNFAHKAIYFILPNKKHLKKSKIFEFDISDGVYPKEHWVITLSFEGLHKLFCEAFTKYWRKEYFSRRKLKI